MRICKEMDPMVEERVRRKLAAILATDVGCCSRLMREDEAGTLARLKECREKVIDPNLACYGGRIVKVMGDGSLVDFASTVVAAQAALDLRAAMAERKGELTDLPARDASRSAM